jgi:3-oxoacyl-[acyl-carrier protein] reductase
MDLGLTNKVALVTGGSDGIGKAAALSLAREGARVAICARGKEKLDQAAEEIRSETGAEVLALPCDVWNEAEVQSMVEQIAGQWGRIDILFNNAGTSAAAPFENVTDEVWARDFGIKVYGAIYCTRAVAPHMRAAGGGAIINISTGGGKAPAGGSLPTSLSRAAGLALTKAMAHDFASDNIRVNAVCIGLIKAGQHEQRFEAARERDSSLTIEKFYEGMGQRVPLGRVGEAQEAGDVVAFLASERASYLTGTAINIDGGLAPIL